VLRKPGIAYRDLRLSNIFVASNGEIRLGNRPSALRCIADDPFACFDHQLKPRYLMPDEKNPDCQDVGHLAHHIMSCTSSDGVAAWASEPCLSVQGAIDGEQEAFRSFLRKCAEADTLLEVSMVCTIFYYSWSMTDIVLLLASISQL
jgi:hypothetical protein